MKRFSASTALCFALAAGVASIASLEPVAHAADETAKARATFQEGVQLEAAGNYATALAKFQEVAAVKRTPTVVFHIAFCQEKLGHLVEALGGYRLAEHDAEGDAKAGKVQQTAAEAIAALEKRIPTLTVKRGKNADLAKISVDGTELGNTSLEKPQQVDPGSHSIDGKAEGVEPFHVVVKVAEGDTKTVEVTFKERPVAVAKPDGGDKGDKGDKPDKKKEEEPAPAQTSVLPYVIGGAGVVSLILSGVFFLGEKSASNDLDSMCKGNICPASAQSTQDKAKTDALLGNITLGLGIVGVGVGTFLLVTQKPSAPAADAARITPKYDVRISPTNGGMGASLVGNFLSLRSFAVVPPLPRSGGAGRRGVQRAGSRIRRREVQGGFAAGRGRQRDGRHRHGRHRRGGHDGRGDDLDGRSLRDGRGAGRSGRDGRSGCWRQGWLGGRCGWHVPGRNRRRSWAWRRQRRDGRHWSGWRTSWRRCRNCRRCGHDVWRC